MDKFLLYITFFLLLFPLFSLAVEETIPTNEEEPFAFIANNGQWHQNESYLNRRQW